MLKINNISNKTHNINKNKHINKVKKSFSFPTCNNNYLAKNLALLGLLGSTSLIGCEWDIPHYIQNQNLNNEKLNISNSVDTFLNTLGLITSPNNTFEDIKNFSFNSNKGESIYCIVDTKSDKEIKLRQIKFNADFSREDSEIYIKKSNIGLQLLQIKGYQSHEMQLIVENNELKLLKKENDIFVEKSTLYKTSNDSFVQNFIDGTIVEYNNIQNNTEIPENLYFEEPEEIDDDIVF